MTFFLCTAAVFFIDLLIKNKIEKSPSSSFPKKRFGCTLQRLHNRGLMLNFLEEKPRLARALSLTAFLLAFLLYLPHGWKKGAAPFKLSMGMLMGGALSNLYDHFKRGYVVDYISLPVPKIRHIVFNLSDFCIFFGAAFAVFWECFHQ